MQSFVAHAPLLVVTITCLGALVMCVVVYLYGFAWNDDDDDRGRIVPRMAARVGHAVAGACFGIGAMLATVVMATHAPMPPGGAGPPITQADLDRMRAEIAQRVRDAVQFEIGELETRVTAEYNALRRAEDRPGAGGRRESPSATGAPPREGRGDVPVAAKPAPASPLPSALSGAAIEVSAFHPEDRLAEIRAGDPKQRVYDLFATELNEHRGAPLKVEGLRRRASARSSRNTVVEVGDVILAARNGSLTPYWFLFEDRRLVAWGRPEEWKPMAERHQLELPYAADTLLDEARGRGPATR